jgi:NADH-ubiquinone oxidoreductase chain 5
LTPLFLTAGAVIHALANEQDIRKFGGLQQVLIFSYAALLIGTLALVGTPFLTGFYSKDVILEFAYARYNIAGHFSYALTGFSVFTTSYYSFRLLFFCFNSGNPGIKKFPYRQGQGTNRSSIAKNSLSLKKFVKYTNIYKQYAGAQDADRVMCVVLFILAYGSIYAGWFFRTMFIGLGSDFWNNSIFIKPNNGLMIEAEFLSPFIKIIPLVLTLAGALLASQFTLVWVTQAYMLGSTYFRALYLFLNQRWFYDKLLNEAIGYSSYKLGFDFVKVFDKGLLEMLPIFGLGLQKFLKSVYIRLGATQSGLIYHYATIMILAALCALTILSFTNLILFIDFRIFVLMLACLLIV